MPLALADVGGVLLVSRAVAGDGLIYAVMRRWATLFNFPDPTFSTSDMAGYVIVTHPRRSWVLERGLNGTPLISRRPP